MTLKSYVASRILLAFPMILFLLTVVFVILRIIPGDPLDLILGPLGTPSERASLSHQLGLDVPLPVQYINYVAGIFQGQFGTSLQSGDPVSSELLQYLPNTAELAIASLFFALAIGIPIGAFVSQRPGSRKDWTARLYAIVVHVIPVFWLGLVFQLVFGVYLHLFPVAGIGPSPDHRVTGLNSLDFLLVADFGGFLDSLRYLFMPAFTLGLFISGVFVRLTRNYMVETLGQDYTLAAKTRGIKNRTILYRYGLRNALIPLITLIGLQLAGLFAGATLTEVTFSWPGLGRYLVSRIGLRDYPAVQGAIVTFAIIVIIVNLLVDIGYAYLDPRVKL